MTKFKLLALASLLALAPGLALAPIPASAKDDHKTQINTPIPETSRTSQQPLDAKKKGGSDPVEQHNQKSAQPVDSGNASPRPANRN